MTPTDARVRARVMAEERKKPAARKASTAKKTTAKKAPAKRAAAKPAAKKPAAKKPAAKKAPAKSAAKKAPAKRATTARKPAAKKPAARKPAAKKPAAKKPAAKKAPAKRAAAAKSATAKKAPAKRASTAKPTPAKAPAKKAPATKAAGTRKRAASRPPVNLQPISASASAPTARTSGNGSSKTETRQPTNGSSGSGRKDMPPASQTPAPSIGPHTEIEHVPPEERLAGHEISQTDAMGLDKRRSVVGGSYGPSLGRQATIYGIFIAVVAAIVVGFVVLVNELDQPEDKYPATAPWQDSKVKPAPLDFPRLGNQAAVPVD